MSDLSSQDEDGIWKVTCLNTQRSFLLYNDPRYWNPDLRKNFFKQVTFFLFRQWVFGIKVTMGTIELKPNKINNDKELIYWAIDNLYLNDKSLNLIKLTLFFIIK